MSLQPREHSIPCTRCRKRPTWNASGLCDDCAFAEIEMLLDQIRTGLGDLSTRVAEVCQRAGLPT